MLLRAFVGGARDPGALEATDATLAQRAHVDVASILGISHEPQLARVYRWERRNPQHEVGHLDRLARIERALERWPGLYVTGSGFRGVGLPDCIADGRATAVTAAERSGRS